MQNTTYVTYGTCFVIGLGVDRLLPFPLVPTAPLGVPGLSVLPCVALVALAGLEAVSSPSAGLSVSADYN